MRKFLLFFFMAPLFLPSFALANDQEKISEQVWKEMNQNTDQSISVILYLNDQVDLDQVSNLKNLSREEKGRIVYQLLTDKAESTQTALIHWLSQHQIHFQQFYIINAIALFDVNRNLIKQLAQRSDIAKIVLNPKMRILPRTNYLETLGELDWKEKGIGSNIASTGADRVWKELKVQGENIVVGGQDTGVDWTHPALKAHYRGGVTKVDHSLSWHDSIKKPLSLENLNSCGYNLTAPCDDNGHGTHTMGTIVGDDGRDNQIGMAPKATWVACRNMDAGLGRPSTYIECFEWFLAPYPQNGHSMKEGRPEMAPHVINNSWGCPADEGCHDAEILPVLKALKVAGIMVVASAGNEGPGCSTIANAPAMHSEDSLSVGAHNHSNGQIASFSSRGPSAYDGQIGPEVTAPGVAIRSSLPGGGYAGAFWSGTSMAGPHVAGQVALMWSAHPDLIGNIEETKRIIRLSATPKETKESCGGVSGNAIPNNTFGYGMINAFKAVNDNF